MHLVHLALKLLPSKVKNELRKNETLANLYSSQIRKNGLFYQYPSDKKIQKLYENLLAVYRELENGNYPEKGQEIQVIVFPGAAEEKTVSNLRKSGFEIIRVISDETETAAKSDSLSSVISELDDSLPTLLLNAGDNLSPNAIVLFLEKIKSARLVYCDIDELDDTGKPTKPRFFPDWSPEFQLTSAYVNTGAMIDTSILKTLNLSGISTIPSLVTSVWLNNPSIEVSHIPQVLVHAHRATNSVKSGLNEIKKCLEKEHGASVETNHREEINEVTWDNDQPLVSLIIPTKNAKSLVKACIDSIFAKTLYSNFEILLIDNSSDDPESLEYFESLKSLDKVRVLKYPSPFNYSAINNFGVSKARGSVIGLINNDIEVISPKWLTQMVGYVSRSDIGCVGARLYYSDDYIQHAGVVLGYGGGAGHAHKYFPRAHSGYLKRLSATNNYSAVTAACLLVKKKHFVEVGGLNEKDLAVAFNDVDFCLKVKKLGVRNVYCAEAELYHHESVSRGLDTSPEKAARFAKELDYLKRTWAPVIEHDPAYNPNLTLKRENFAIKGEIELKETLKL